MSSIPTPFFSWRSGISALRKYFRKKLTLPLLLLHAQISIVFGPIDSLPFFYSFSERNTKGAFCIENSDSTILQVAFLDSSPNNSRPRCRFVRFMGRKVKVCWRDKRELNKLLLNNLLCNISPIWPNKLYHTVKRFHQNSWKKWLKRQFEWTSLALITA